MTSQKNEKIVLNASKRTVFGKANRMLRKQQKLPANVYGQKEEPIAITLDRKEFVDVYKNAGETSVIYLHIDKKEIPTLIVDSDIDPVRNSILHIDFQQVNLKQAVEASVPFEFVGESDAVKSHNGVLLTLLDEVTVKALPTDIPNSIVIDLSTLVAVGDSITVSDLPKSDTYEVVEDPDRQIVSVAEHKEEELIPDVTSEAPEITSEEDEESSEDGTPSEKTGAEEPDQTQNDAGNDNA